MVLLNSTRSVLATDTLDEDGKNELEEPTVIPVFDQ